MKKITLCLLLFSSVTLFAQQELLQSGPMLGYSEMREVALWVQTKLAAEVQFLYWDQQTPEKKFWTNKIVTEKSAAFTATLIADSLEPGNSYHYDVYINNQKLSFNYPTTFRSQPIWKWRGDPPEFTIATGSGAYINEEKYDRPGTPYGSHYHIFESIHNKNPNLMIWLGDNFYYREPDWNSRTGITHRITHTRSLPELQPLLASTHHYSIWDDHDFGPNDSDKSFWFKEKTLETYQLFFPNPYLNFRDMPGITSFFQYGDADFFLLDNRYHRDPNKSHKPNKSQLGKTQLQWLKDALCYSEATFKIIAIGGQFLNTTKSHETYSNNGFAGERDEIIQFIYNNNIKNIVFLTGDKHFTELSKLQSFKNPLIYDLTTSSFTSGINTNGDKEQNALRVENTLIMEHNFSILKFSGSEEERKLIITIYNSYGEKLWDYEIKPE